MFEVLIGRLCILVTDKVEISRKDRMKYLERRSDRRKNRVGWVVSVVDGSVSAWTAGYSVDLAP